MPVIKSIGRRIWNTLTFRPAERQKPLPQTAYNPIIGQLRRVDAQKVELPFGHIKRNLNGGMMLGSKRRRGCFLFCERLG